MTGTSHFNKAIKQIIKESFLDWNLEQFPEFEDLTAEQQRRALAAYMADGFGWEDLFISVKENSLEHLASTFVDVVNTSPKNDPENERFKLLGNKLYKNALESIRSAVNRELSLEFSDYNQFEREPQEYNQFEREQYESYEADSYVAYTNIHSPF